MLETGMSESKQSKNNHQADGNYSVQKEASPDASLRVNKSKERVIVKP